MIGGNTNRRVKSETGKGRLPIKLHHQTSCHHVLVGELRVGVYQAPSQMYLACCTQMQGPEGQGEALWQRYRCWRLEGRLLRWDDPRGYWLGTNICHKLFLTLLNIQAVFRTAGSTDLYVGSVQVNNGDNLDRHGPGRGDGNTWRRKVLQKERTEDWLGKRLKRA